MAWAPVKAKTIKHDHKIHYTFYLCTFVFACSIVITEYDATPYRGMAQEKMAGKLNVYKIKSFLNYTMDLISVQLCLLLAKGSSHCFQVTGF